MFPVRLLVAPTIRAVRSTAPRKLGRVGWGGPQFLIPFATDLAFVGDDAEEFQELFRFADGHAPVLPRVFPRSLVGSKPQRWMADRTPDEPCFADAPEPRMGWRSG
jgi:hypothetical protein